MGLPDVLTGGHLILLVLIGLGAGVLSGFSGVGGGFIVTPALIILGFPANFAVGTSLAWVAGNSVVGVLRHGRMGNIDFGLGIVMLISSMAGLEGGLRLLNWMKQLGFAENVVLAVSAVMLVSVGTFTVVESFRRRKEIDLATKRNGTPPPMLKTGISVKFQRLRLPPILRLKKADVTISLWLVVTIGLCVGLLSGLMGVGGGFIMVPALVYLLGVPTFVAVGTDLFQIMFSASYGTIRNTLSDNVVIVAAAIILIASSVGVQFGTLATRYVRGVSVRYVLGISSILSAAGVVLKLVGVMMNRATFLDTVSVYVIFGSIFVIVVMIGTLYIAGRRYRSGRNVPYWIVSLVASDTDPGKLKFH